jgi:hypothetical protein
VRESNPPEAVYETAGHTSTLTRHRELKNRPDRVVLGGSPTVTSVMKLPGHAVMADHVTVAHRVAPEVLHVVKHAGQIIVGQQIIHGGGASAATAMAPATAPG